MLINGGRIESPASEDGSKPIIQVIVNVRILRFLYTPRQKIKLPLTDGFKYYLKEVHCADHYPFPPMQRTLM
jgi:hypothetical protein